MALLYFLQSVQWIRQLYRVDWVSIAPLVIAVASLVIAQKSLAVTRLAIKQSDEDWRQRKWFDLYFKANEACTLLERFQTLNGSSPSMNPEKRADDYNELMFAFRSAISFGAVFPQNEAISDLFEAMQLQNLPEVLRPERLGKVSDAVEGLRQKALLNPAVLCTPMLYPKSDSEQAKQVQKVSSANSVNG